MSGLTELLAAPKCTHWLGHKFEARYSTGPSDPAAYNGYKGPAIALNELAEKSRAITYERDVCVRCGHVIARTPATGGKP